MKITRSSTPTRLGMETFTGSVYVDTIASGSEGIVAAMVHFAPGARTAWHTHALGQTIHVTEGVGWAQCEGEPIVEIRPGDSVFFEPGENHWHGASSERFMAHLAMVRQPDSGEGTAWGRLVTDEEYTADDRGSLD